MSTTAASRRWFNRKYKTDPVFREQRKEAAAQYFKRQCAADPHYKQLVKVRALIAKKRSQIEAHQTGIAAKEKRMAVLTAEILNLNRERVTLESRRAQRKKNT